MKKIKGSENLGRPIKGDRPKTEKITVRIESKEKSLLIKTYGSISEGIDHLLKRFLKENR